MGRIPLLDLGNVVVKVDFSPFLHWLAERAGHGSADRVAPLLRSSLFYDFEFGQISRTEFSRRVARLTGAAFADGELEERFCGIFPGLVEGMDQALEGLAAKGPVYCLSNTNELHLEFLRARYPLLSCFHTIFASHEMGRRKPYPGIYRDVARRLGVDPGEIFFFDDVAANVEGALRAGMDAQVFQGVGPMLVALKESINSDDNA